MLNREDMLELSRRMTVERANFDRVAGAYMDPDGFVDGTFNTHFLKLNNKEKNEQLQLFKAVVFAETNKDLKEYDAPSCGPGEIGQLLYALRDCGLKNDALLQTFYEIVGEKIEISEPYGIFVGHGVYDVPLKGTDKEYQMESEEVYDYLVVSVAPVDKDYNPGETVCGFIYPSFKNRSQDMNHIAVFKRNTLLFTVK